MRNLKKFETHAEYEAAESSLILPNVSICVDTPNEVYYKPIDPYNGHDYVEIGGIKWATKNVGANNITDYGLYFAWGETEGYANGSGNKKFKWDDYKYCSGAGTENSAMTKYNSTDGKTVLDIEDDAARANMGGYWRMPTAAEFQSLSAAVNTAYTTNYKNSGVGGFVLTDKTDSSKVLFFPAAGSYSNGNNSEVTDRPNVLSSSLKEEQNDKCYIMYGIAWPEMARGMRWNYTKDRYVGCSVRGVIVI